MSVSMAYFGQSGNFGHFRVLSDCNVDMILKIFALNMAKLNLSDIKNVPVMHEAIASCYYFPAMRPFFKKVRPFLL